ncbi:MAG: polysulfide reductase NrfD, partial [Eggerthellaceae bacterium]|nr:polysulfide reductase NrfD [Eggerthellaceae bacterium]
MVALQTTWSWLPAIYLFLGGLGAGAFITAAILRFAKPGRFDKVVTGGAWIAVIALAVGLLSLVAEVE